MRADLLALRARIVAAVEAGEVYPVVAQHFGVTVATIGSSLRLRRATGSVAPRPRPGTPPEIGPVHDPALWVRHCAAWAATAGRVVSVSTMGRTIARLGRTHGKTVGGRERVRADGVA